MLVAKKKNYYHKKLIESMPKEKVSEIALWLEEYAKHCENEENENMADLCYLPTPVGFNVYGNFSNRDGFQNIIHGETGFFSEKVTEIASLLGSGALKNYFIFICFDDKCLIVISKKELTEDISLNRGNFQGDSRGCKTPASSRRTFIVFEIPNDQLDYLGDIDENTSMLLENGEKLAEHLKANKTIKSMLMVPFYKKAQPYSEEDELMLKFVLAACDNVRFSYTLTILDGNKPLKFKQIRELARIIRCIKGNKRISIGRQIYDERNAGDYVVKSYYNYGGDYVINAAPYKSNYTFLDKKHLVLDYSEGLLTEANFDRMISNPMFEDLFRRFSRYLDCATLREKIEYLNNCLDEVANNSRVRRR